MPDLLSWYGFPPEVLLDILTRLDARPDYSLQSSDFRMEVSCSAGFNHINAFVHPQAVLIDASGDEDDFLLSAFRTRANVLDRTLIELPKNIEQNLMWIVQLDSAALSGKYISEEGNCFRLANKYSLDQNQH